MQRYKYIFFVLAFAILGCDKGFEELNIDPNNDDSVDPSALFAHAQHQFATDYNHGVRTEVWGLNVWMQMQANINGLADPQSRYFVGGDNLDNTWGLYYAKVLGNVNEAIRLTENNASLSNHTAIFKIYRAYVFQRISDLWGSVPYSEALAAVSDSGVPNFTPAYDSQQLIYINLLNNLAQAVQALDDSKSSLGSQDWMYQGDVDKWRRFGNSLRLRMALRIADKDPERAQEIGEALIMSDTFINSVEGAATFPNSNAAQRPFYRLDALNQGIRHPSKFLIETLKADQDPTLAKYAEFSSQSLIFGAPDYNGMPNFLLSNEIDENIYSHFTISAVGNHFLSVNLPTVLMSYSESMFLRAEAALRGWGGGAPNSFYVRGVQAHHEFLEISNLETEQYLAGQGQFDGTLETIITEKWKTFVYMDAIEAFNEYRRTGFPVLKDISGAPINPDQVPKRLAYPPQEISLNGNAVMAVGHGINDYFTQVWWDVN